MDYLAHKQRSRVQPLHEHLNNTAALAEGFAGGFGSGEAAFRCGLLHDIGKYSEAFQRRIMGAEMNVDHSTAGTIEAYRAGDEPAAFCIAGHHGGIPNLGVETDDARESGTLCARLKRRPGEEIEDYSAYEGEIAVPQAETQQRLTASREEEFFYTHMLYSCLVDADWLDTEAFMKTPRCPRAARARRLRSSQQSLTASSSAGSTRQRRSTSAAAKYSAS